MTAFIYYKTRAGNVYSTEQFESMAEELDAKAKEIANLQYRIDELMLEYCPNEMTEEQLENYKAHQRPYLDEAIRGLGDI